MKELSEAIKDAASTKLPVREVVPRTEADPEQRPAMASGRTCIGCGQQAAPGEMIRLVLGPSGEVAVDAAGGGFGRGAHVHARSECLRQAVPRGLARATKGKAAKVCIAVKDGAGVSTSDLVPLTVQAFGQAIEAAMARRIAGLLGTAVRTRRARIGADAVTTAWHTGDAALLIVAVDAAAGAELSAVRDAVAAGAAVAWGTKQSLASALLRASEDGVAVAAILDTRIAEAVRDAVEKSMGARDVQRSSPRQSAPREVRQSGPREGFQSKMAVKRAGRASGRQLRRARGTKTVVERSE